MKVLFLCNHPCAVNSGGHQRLNHVLKAVASVGEVTLVYPIIHRAIGSDLAALRPFCKQICTFPLESLAYQRDPCLPRPLFWIKHKLRYLHPVASAFMQQMRSEEANALVANICLQRFDLIWCSRVSSIQMLPRSLESRIIVDLDDLEHRKLRARLQLWKDPPHMLPLQQFEFLKLKYLEHSLRKLPYEFVVCSEIDKATLGASSKVWVIPNGIDLPAELVCPGSEKSEPILAFVGLMSYEPNEDAAVFFARRVVPLIQRDIPNVKFLIVGRDPTPSVTKLHDGKSIVVTGTVADVAEYLFSASVVVVPIRFGGGTRIKILEALAHRKAVVSTTMGAEGIEVQSGKHLLLADSPEDLAKACARLLKDRGLRMRLGEEGFCLIRERYQWKDIERITKDIVISREYPSSKTGNPVQIESPRLFVEHDGARPKFSKGGPESSQETEIA
jgi:glycosyltransferase involved in cell wall biosynthesis